MWNRFITAVNEAFTWLGTELFKIGEASITYGVVFRALLLLLAAYVVSRLVQQALTRFSSYRQNGMSSSTLYTIKRLSHYTIMVIGFIIAIASLGIDLTKFAIFASALGVGIGFGLQNLISNFSAGLILLFDKTLKVGDFVELESGVTGEVKEIAIRSTIITTNDNIDIIVPNSEFINFRVTNWTMTDTFRRLKVRFGVAYNSDKEQVRKAVLEAADRVQFTLKDSYHKSPQVWLRNFGDNALEFDLVVWLTADAINRPSAVQAAYMWEIHSSLVEYGIEIPFPQRDLHVRSWSAEALPPANAKPAAATTAEAQPHKPDHQ